MLGWDRSAFEYTVMQYKNPAWGHWVHQAFIACPIITAPFTFHTDSLRQILAQGGILLRVFSQKILKS